MKTLLQIILSVLIFLLILYYSPTLLDCNPKANYIPLPAFDGLLAENYKLSEAEHLFKGILHGPESMVFHEGNLYTGLADGRVVIVKENEIITVAQTGRQCEMPQEEKLCGRPLGMRVGRDGLLYIVDGFYGIFNLNLSMGSLTRVLPNTVLVEGQELRFPDDMDIDDAGNIYFSDASTRWDVSTVYYLMLEYEGAGRIIRYNLYSGETEVLAKGLYFPNGIQLARDKRSILFAEVSNRRILRLHIKGPKKGEMEVFADVLPGESDNIRLSAKGYWVAFTFARNHTNPNLLDILNGYPNVKYLGERLHHALGTLMIGLAELSTVPTLKKMAYKFKRGDYYLPLIPRHGIIIEFDEDGNMIRSFHSPDGKISDLSQVTEYEGYLYLGSFVNDYLGRLKL